MVVQHEDRLAALDRREADLKAQHQSIASTVEAHKNKEGMTVRIFTQFGSRQRLSCWCQGLSLGAV